MGGIQREAIVHIHTADSLCCTAETNATLQSNYTPKIKFKNEMPKKLVTNELKLKNDDKSEQTNFFLFVFMFGGRTKFFNSCWLPCLFFGLNRGQ